MDTDRNRFRSIEVGLVSTSSDQSAFGSPPVHTAQTSVPTLTTSPNVGLTCLNGILTTVAVDWVWIEDGVVLVGVPLDGVPLDGVLLEGGVPDVVIAP